MFRSLAILNKLFPYLFDSTFLLENSLDQLDLFFLGNMAVFSFSLDVLSIFVILHGPGFYAGHYAIVFEFINNIFFISKGFFNLSI